MPLGVIRNVKKLGFFLELIVFIFELVELVFGGRGIGCVFILVVGGGFC